MQAKACANLRDHNHANPAVGCQKHSTSAESVKLPREVFWPAAVMCTRMLKLAMLRAQGQVVPWTYTRRGTQRRCQLCQEL